jgi:OmpA-OmpF porin, OOP family
MLKKSIVTATLFIAGLALSAGASAQTYVGGTIGQSSAKYDSTGVSSAEKNGTAFHLIAGYSFSPNLAVEGGYFNLGKSTVSVSGITVDFKGSGLDLAAVLKTDSFDGFMGFAKLGGAYVKGETSVSFPGFSGGVSENTFQALVGLGVAYKLSDTVQVRVEYERSL